MSFHVPDNFRVRIPGFPAGDHTCGCFLVPIKGATPVQVIASASEGWEHVSVSRPNRCPTWAEMCHIKDVFWDESDCVMQLHPPKSEYVNSHQFCLHMWKPYGAEIPMPPSYMVGYKELGVLA